MHQVLLVDDDNSFREVMRFHLDDAGIPAAVATDGNDALRQFRRQPFPVVVTDLKMPGMDGMALLDEVRRLAPDTLVIVITAFGDVATAVQAMKEGAYDFIAKPCEREHFVLVVQRALEVASLKAELRSLKDSASANKDFIFASATMRTIIETLDRVADSHASVLLLGESGTGKELLAHRLHRQSPRSSGPFVAVNCAAIPRDLMESELFGHKKGAFTGAVQDRKGRFEQANKGTLFLDEIAEMPLDLQPRLLRALQERTVDKVGGDRPTAVDVRIVAATNRDLATQVSEGNFRADLFYRLNIVPLDIPPLRERPEDILPLAEFFVSRFAPNQDKQLTGKLLRELEQHSWPGNARELENVCQRLVLLSRDNQLDVDLLATALPDLRRPSTTEILPGTKLELPPEGLDLRELEKAIILYALKRSKYNQSAAARYLSIPRHKLLYRLEKYGIEGTAGDDGGTS
jgi:DNA-binding NtrC family response regulator